METKKVILVLISIILVFLLFSTFRPGITTAATLCASCQQVSDCENTCYSSCLAKGYDVVTSTGIENDAGKVECSCTCESFLNNKIRGK
ncbi:hypothetical protein HY491_01095 [Candidatus Woesearchaeota archaeon]|nr:hypothetical protein [Candidatus Woesearchaeota archaeon]